MYYLYTLFVMLPCTFFLYVLIVPKRIYFHFPRDIYPRNVTREISVSKYLLWVRVELEFSCGPRKSPAVFILVRQVRSTIQVRDFERLLSFFSRKHNFLVSYFLGACTTAVYESRPDFREFHADSSVSLFSSAHTQNWIVMKS